MAALKVPEEDNIKNRDPLNGSIRVEIKRLDQRIDAQTHASALSLAATREASALALTAAEKAAEKSELMIEGRLRLMNEWREALTEVLAKTVPRSEIDLRMKLVEDQITSLKALQQGVSRTWAYIAGVGGLVVATWVAVWNIVTGSQ